MDVCWLAGFVEGCGQVMISVTDDRPLGQLHVSLTSDDIATIDALAATWGGTVRPHRSGARQWRAQARQAARFLQALEPYFQTARMRAQTALALEYQTLKQQPRGSYVPEGYHDQQQIYAERMRELRMYQPRLNHQPQKAR